jgi:hypothetical protein
MSGTKKAQPQGYWSRRAGMFSQPDTQPDFDPSGILRQMRPAVPEKRLPYVPEPEPDLSDVKFEQVFGPASNGRVASQVKRYQPQRYADWKKQAIENGLI